MNTSYGGEPLHPSSTRPDAGTRAPAGRSYEYSAGLLLGMAIAGWLVIGIILWPLCIYMASRSRRMGDERGMTLAALIIASIGLSLVALCIVAVSFL